MEIGGESQLKKKKNRIKLITFTTMTVFPCFKPTSTAAADKNNRTNMQCLTYFFGEKIKAGLESFFQINAHDNK